MVINTRILGEVEVDEEKIITFENGIIGFPNLTQFALVYDSEGEEGSDSKIKWLQSLQDGMLAIPVINPLLIVPDYNPTVEDEWLKPLGEFASEELVILTTITVPKDLTLMSINLKAPIVISAETKKACQIITEDEAPVKFYIYDLLNKNNREGEN